MCLGCLKEIPGAEDPGYRIKPPPHVPTVARLFRRGDFLSAAFLLTGFGSVPPGK
jgi:hypothetical protein